MALLTASVQRVKGAWVRYNRRTGGRTQLLTCVQCSALGRGWSSCRDAVQCRLRWWWRWLVVKVGGKRRAGGRAGGRQRVVVVVGVVGVVVVEGQ